MITNTFNIRKVSMGGTIILLFLFFCPVMVFATTDSDFSAHSERTFDAYVGLNQTEIESSCWIMSGRALIEESGGKSIFNNNVYSETIESRSDYFIVKNDSLLWTGHNNGRRYGTLFTTPVPLCSVHDIQGTPFKREFCYNGQGLLDVSTTYSITGVTWCETVSTGSIVLAPDDTLKNVTLMKHIDNSVRFFDVTEESDTLTRTVYRWYTEGVPIPIAVQCENKLFITTSRDNLTEIEYTLNKDSENRVKEIIENATVVYQGTTVTVTLTESLSLHVYIMDVVGNIYSHTRGLSDNFTLDVSGLPHNNYVVSIVGDCVEGCTRRILLTI